MLESFPHAPGSKAQTEDGRRWIFWLALLMGGLAFLIYRNAVLNHFYEFGGSADSLWYAGMLWHGDVALSNPVGLDDGGASFFTVHASPLLIPFALASHFFLFDHIEWLALVLGLMHGFCCAAAVWVMGRACATGRLPMRVGSALTFVLGSAYALVPLQAQFVVLPHPEILQPGLLIALLAAIALRARYWAALWFFLVIAAREDSGFHVAAFLLPVIALMRLQSGRWPIMEVRYAFAGLLLSVVIFSVMAEIPGAQNMGGRNYLGDPVLAHLNLDEAGRRFKFFALQSGHIWAPMLVLVIAAAVMRNLWLLAGVVAVAPWLAINLLFGTPVTTWTLQYFYAFPVLTMLAWPSLLNIYRYGPLKLDRTGLHPVVQVAVLLAAFCPVLGKPEPPVAGRYQAMNYSLNKDAFSQPAYAAFARALELGRSELGALMANYSAIAVAPKFLRRAEWLEDYAAKPKEQRARLDTILFFERPFSCGGLEQAWLDDPFAYQYDVIGTRIVIFSRKPLEQLPSFSALLRPVPDGVKVCERHHLSRHSS